VPINIGLDYDGTFTADPNLWLRFILDAQAAGHEVHVVTMRYPSETANADPEAKNYFDPRLRALGCRVHATSRGAKKPYMLQHGINIHVWIDDNPKAVDLDATVLWPDQDIAPEGHPVVPVHG